MILDAGNGGGNIGLQAIINGNRRENADGIAAAFVLDRLDRRLFLCDRAVRTKHRNRLCAFEHTADVRVLLALQRRLDGVERIRTRRLQNGLRRFEPRGAIRAHQRQTAESRANRTAQIVVDLDLSEIVLGFLADHLPGQRIHQIHHVAGGFGDKNLIVGFPDIEITVGKGLQCRHDLGVT